jgi:PiT family inorganic phosphate transporter
VANALMRVMDGTSGVDWNKATEIGYSLLLSPLFGFCLAALVLLVLKFIVRSPTLYSQNQNAPPPWWSRAILILTCTGVPFAHGSIRGRRCRRSFRRARSTNAPTTYPSLAALVREISQQVESYGIAKLPGQIVAKTRNDIYLASESGTLYYLARVF